MLNKIIEKLNALGCTIWELTETEKHSWEFYFIRHKLDQNRAVAVKDVEVTLYQPIEDGKFLGSASASISPTASDADVDKTLRDLMYQASLVKNPAYTLTDKPITIPDKTDPVDVEAIADDFIRAMQAIPETVTEDVNSYEIFVSEKRRHTKNSNGVEYTCVYPDSMIEVIVNARRDGHEIELYRQFTSGTCDKEKLTADVESALRYGRDRLSAVPTPKLGSASVLFSTQDATEIYDYFAARTNASMKVRGISDYEIGKPVCPQFTGDRVSIESVPELPNSSKNFPVDREGSLVRSEYIIRDGVVEHFWGDRQFSQYLGIDDGFLVSNIRVTGGSASAQELREGDSLEIVEFSDFQVDPMGGDIAGEIRLGYLRRGGKTTIVTGGSVSGSMLEAAQSMRFSKELVQYDNYLIPAVTQLQNLRITGIAELE